MSCGVATHLGDPERALREAGRDAADLERAFWARSIETAGWCFTATGSRFAVHPSPGAARDLREKLADAGTVHRLTGGAPETALNTLVDLVDVDGPAVAAMAEEAGARVGSLCPNLSRDPRFRFGTLANRDPATRTVARDLILAGLEHAEALGATALSLWLPDGLHYPGQDDIGARRDRLVEELARIAPQVPGSMQMLLEYKLYEPAPYHTDIPDWGTALYLARAAGPGCTVLVDFGHHAHGVNIPAILSILAAEGRLGALHLNDRLNADDDLTLGSINPLMMLLSMAELAALPDQGASVRFGLDQHHTAKQPLLATVQSVCRAQETWLRALLIDREALAAAQAAHDTVAAEEVLHDALAADLRPLIALWRERRGLTPDPLAEARVVAARNIEERT